MFISYLMCSHRISQCFQSILCILMWMWSNVSMAGTSLSFAPYHLVVPFAFYTSLFLKFLLCCEGWAVVQRSISMQTSQSHSAYIILYYYGCEESQGNSEIYTIYKWISISQRPWEDHNVHQHRSPTSIEYIDGKCINIGWILRRFRIRIILLTVHSRVVT